MAQRVPVNKRSAAALLSSLLVLGLCSFQFGDRYNLNSMPFAQVEPLVSDLGKAQRMARQGNLELLAGRPVSGQNVQLRGELSDSNCYLGNHTHAYDHAFCAKLCVAAGSPLVFISDQGGQVYFVVTSKNAVRIPNEILDSIGVPGISVSGRLIASEAGNAVAIETLDKAAAGKKR